MRTTAIFSVVLFAVSAVIVCGLDVAKEPSQNNSDQGKIISLEGDTKVNDYFQDEDGIDEYYWEDWAFSDEGHPLDDSDETEEDSQEEDVANHEPITLGVAKVTASPVSDVDGTTESAAKQKKAKAQEKVKPAANMTKTGEFNDPDYYQPDPEVVYYDEKGPVVETELEITITREKSDDKLPQVLPDWPAEVPKDSNADANAPNQEVNDTAAASSSDEGYYGDWSQLVRDWRNWKYNERLTQTRRLQALYTGILIGFFALTVAVVLFTFYRGFIVCAAAVRSSANIGGGYKRMEEEAETPVLHQQYP